MEFKEEVEANLARMQDQSPSGFAIGLHLAFTTSKYIIQTYPKPWMEEYSKRGLLLADPTVRWGLENTGFIRWSVLKNSDEAGVIDAAATFGLKFGVSVAIAPNGSRSLGSFASPTGEFDDATIADLTAALENLHTATKDIEPGSPDDALMQRIVGSFASVTPL
ncbi:MAG: autoinducer binding domain-containing protein [Pseudomonadota bacterium]